MNKFLSIFQKIMQVESALVPIVVPSAAGGIAGIVMLAEEEAYSLISGYAAAKSASAAPAAPAAAPAAPAAAGPSGTSLS